MSSQLAVLEMAALLRSGASASAATKQFRIESLSEFEKKQFRFIWSVAEVSGGQLALALDRLAEVLDNQQRQFSELKIAFASPKATANLILLLPIVAVFFSELLGISAVSAALGTSLGAVALGLGAILLIVARVISLRQLHKARPREVDPGAYLDAVVIALSAGLSPTAAAKLSSNKYQEIFLEPVGKTEQRALESAVLVSEQSGIALTGILLARSDALRHGLWSARRAQIQKLGVSLMVPLGLAALPAFVLLAVVPLGLGLFSS